MKDKINSLPKGSIPTLITEVSHRIERMNFLESTEHKADVSGIINVALSELEFEFKKGISEELRIIVMIFGSVVKKYRLNLKPTLTRRKTSM